MTAWTAGYTDVTHMGIADRLFRIFGQGESQTVAGSMTTDVSAGNHHPRQATIGLSQRGSNTEDGRSDAFAVDGTTTEHGITALLETAVQADDVHTLARLVEHIDWSRQSPADFVSAVHLALAVGAHLPARHLAMQGHRLYPEHQELEKMAYVLAPPTVKPSSRPADPSGRRNFEWLEEHAAEFYGEWVALKNGELVAHAPTARALKERLPTVRGLFLARAV
jgi:hypothetical protein